MSGTWGGAPAAASNGPSRRIGAARSSICITALAARNSSTLYRPVTSISTASSSASITCFADRCRSSHLSRRQLLAQSLSALLLGAGFALHERALGRGHDERFCALHLWRRFY